MRSKATTTADPRPGDDASAPSRSQRRREALDVFRLAEMLTALGDAALARVPLDENLREEVRHARAVTSHIAHKRQVQFLAKQLRGCDAEAIAAIRGVLANDRTHAHRQAASLHRVEQWRDRLLDGGDAALDALVALHPQAERARLRGLVRTALRERDGGRPPRAMRELFRLLRELTGDDEPS
jgi:ribosome-associated protein